MKNAYDVEWSRRDLLKWTVAVTTSALSIGVVTEAVAGSAECASSEDEDDGLRSSLNYVEVSPDPQHTCSACAFYTAAQRGACGNCQLLDGGMVQAGGRCDSWSQKS